MIPLFSAKNITVITSSDAKTPVSSAKVRIVDSASGNALYEGMTNKNGILLIPLSKFSKLENLQIIANQEDYIESIQNINPNAQQHLYNLKMKRRASSEDLGLLSSLKGDKVNKVLEETGKKVQVGIKKIKIEYLVGGIVLIGLAFWGYKKFKR